MEALQNEMHVALISIKAHTFTIQIKHLLRNTTKTLVSVNPPGEPRSSVECLSVLFSLFLDSSSKIDAL